MRATWVIEEREGAPVEVLVAVPKKLYRLAVDRNLRKRWMREAYRQSKHTLWAALGQRRMALALVWTTRQPATYAEVHEALGSIIEKIAHELHN